ncbi:MAG: GntR family transcriptional regulator [Gammaproteobacteria bacterium]|nr:GntR family transcriptional regulator [Gammaproteobacteria bacterium]
MDITISVADGVPIYRQIVNQIRYMVASGLLQTGEEVPPIRALALQLNVTPNTVVKAYGELEKVGIVHKRRGAGTYISARGSPLANRERKRILAKRIDAMLAEAHQLDFDVEDVVKMVHRRATVMGRNTRPGNEVEEGE